MEKAEFSMLVRYIDVIFKLANMISGLLPFSAEKSTEHNKSFSLLEFCSSWEDLMNLKDVGK